MNPPALEFCDVTVRYRPEREPTLACVSFAVAPGERIALAGLNGSGKTTLLMTAVGLVPHEGQIRVAGEVLTRRTQAHIRSQIGFLFNVPEDQLLFPTVIEDAAFGLLRRGLSASQAAARARHTLAALGVGHLADASLHHLSHGQKLRVALAGALATEPSLLLLDEPSAGLDPPGRRALADVLGHLPAAMVIATHDLDFATGLCTRFVMLEKGKIGLDGSDGAAVVRHWQR